MPERLKGTVKRWVTEKGYGFIKVEGRNDHFVHMSAIMGTEKHLREGDVVEFTPETGDRGLRAVDVEVI